MTTANRSELFSNINKLARDCFNATNNTPTDRLTVNYLHIAELNGELRDSQIAFYLGRAYSECAMVRIQRVEFYTRRMPNAF